MQYEHSWGAWNEPDVYTYVLKSIQMNKNITLNGNKYLIICFPKMENGHENKHSECFFLLERHVQVLHIAILLSSNKKNVNTSLE